MIDQKECIAMLLAGGKGSRLGILTKKLAKPAIPFGGKYRIIDFTLSNCANSGINTVGVLTQYQPLLLNSYIGIGSSWDLNRRRGGVFVLPPYLGDSGGDWYRGTADAIYRNIEFIDLYSPRYVLILSGDHIYKMDYSKMLSFHKEKEAHATIAVVPVPWEEASRFGLMALGDDDRIIEFQEKPSEPKSNLASMGVYIFTWSKLREYLLEDAQDLESHHDFGKNIIPRMLAAEETMCAYTFTGYWKDVGTIQSLWEANMDLLSPGSELNLSDRNWRIYSVNPNQPPQYIGRDASIEQAMINEGCRVYGTVYHSVLFPGVTVESPGEVRDTVLMSYVEVGKGSKIERAIIGEDTVIEENCTIGGQGEGDTSITVLAENLVIPAGSHIPAGTVISTENYEQYGCRLKKSEGRGLEL